MQIDFPFGFDGCGRTAEADVEAHIRDLIEQLLLTAPGERVNRPTFGSGALQLVFAPNSDTLAAALRLGVQAGLQEWLGDLIEVTDVEIENPDSTLRLEVRYVVRRTRRDAHRHDHEVTMAGLRYLCCSDARRAALEQRPDLNGIDFLEVGDLDPTELDAAEAAEYAALPVTERDRLLWQRRLELFFVNPLLAVHLASLTDANFRITGGERPEFRTIALAVLSTAAQSLVLRASKRGDFSTYRLAVVTPGDPDLSPPPVLDPLASAVDFSFKVECPSDFDCAPQRVCPPEPEPAPQLDYLAKDYASFRRLMLDRMVALAPGWRERHAADLGVTLVELLAYAADHLSYRQDAVATEAYLGTARRRTSIRRHARLVDYRMHDGCNARVWIQVLLDASAPAAGVLLPRADPVTGVTTKFLSRVDADPRLDQDHAANVVAAQKPEVFEMLDASLTLFPEHGRLDFYTWGAVDCCLPAGATRATLAGRLDLLAPGHVLILEEIADRARGPRRTPTPRTGTPSA